MWNAIFTILGLALALVAFNIVCFYGIVILPTRFSKKKKEGKLLALSEDYQKTASR